MKIVRSSVLVSICTIATLVIFAGCDHEEVGPFVAPELEPEPEIAGLVLLRDGKPIIGVHNEQIQGSVICQMGQNSDVYEVEFYAANGDRVDRNPQTYNLAFDSVDSELAWFEQPENPNEWKFHIHGEKTGNTTFELLVKNGKSLDYASPALPLEVR